MALHDDLRTLEKAEQATDLLANRLSVICAHLIRLSTPDLEPLLDEVLAVRDDLWQLSAVYTYDLNRLSYTLASAVREMKKGGTGASQLLNLADHFPRRRYGRKPQ